MIRIDRVMALADAMAQLLDDMGEDGVCVCTFAKAKARIAYEPFRETLEDDGSGLMPMAIAIKIVEDCS
jgi:hypothetical protein